MLAKSYRVPSFEISSIMKTGTRVVGNGITLVYKKRQKDFDLKAGVTARMAFVISTKVDKRATVRNRMRRLMSESIRLRMESLPTIDGVLIGSRVLVGLSYQEVDARLLKLFEGVR